MSAPGYLFELLAQVIDFEPFPGDMDAVLSRSDRVLGRSAHDAVLMFRILFR